MQDRSLCAIYPRAAYSMQCSSCCAAGAAHATAAAAGTAAPVDLCSCVATMPCCACRLGGTGVWMGDLSAGGQVPFPGEPVLPSLTASQDACCCVCQRVGLAGKEKHVHYQRYLPSSTAACQPPHATQPAGDARFDYNETRGGGKMLPTASGDFQVWPSFAAGPPERQGLLLFAAAFWWPGHASKARI